MYTLGSKSLLKRKLDRNTGMERVKGYSLGCWSQEQLTKYLCINKLLNIHCAYNRILTSNSRVTYAYIHQKERVSQHIFEWMAKQVLKHADICVCVYGYTHTYMCVRKVQKDEHKTLLDAWISGSWHPPLFLSIIIWLFNKWHEIINKRKRKLSMLHIHI